MGVTGRKNMHPKGQTKLLREFDLTRVCPCCKNDLAKDKYPRSSWRKGAGNLCFQCSSKLRKQKRLANLDKFRAADKERYRRYKHTSTRAYEIKKKYGLSIDQVNRMVVRQYGRCLGCQDDLVLEGKWGERFHIDHDHKKNAVRGLLCHGCNTALGLTKEDPATLRRLMSYLDTDRSKLNVYVIGSLRNPQIPHVGNRLRAEGFIAYDDWFSGGELADDSWQAYEKIRGRSYREALKGKSAQNVFLFDRSLLDLADAAILVAPGGRSAFIELGYFAGCGKPSFILAEKEMDRYEVMPNFAHKICDDLDGLVKELHNISIT